MSKHFTLPKRYNPLIEEEKLFEIWQNEKLFRFSHHSAKPLFIIDTPPPYSNASWHIGGAIHYSQIDMIARTMRMKGYELLFPMGLDRNGLPIEIQTEKEYKINMHTIPRESFIQNCKELLDKYGSQILDLTKKLGLSCNSYEWNDIYKTDEVQFRAFTQSIFIELYEKGLIYEDDRPTNWDPILQTSISDAEIEYKESEHTLYTIEFSLTDIPEKITISTTRPELLSSIGLIIYNPNDERYQHLENKKAKIPIWGKEIKILPHPSAKPEFGSGLVMICSFGDLTDIQIFRELGLTPNYSITSKGTLSDLTGKYSGMSILEGRKSIINDLKEQQLILSEETIPYQAPTNERSGALIEFIGMNEFYIKQLESLDTLKEMANAITFLPEQSRGTWLNWLDKINIDWPISRRRFYGTEIPLWYCANCHRTIIPPAGPYYQPWKDKPPIDHCPDCLSTSFIGETRIFDTWMDSSNSAMYIRTHPENKFSSTLSDINNQNYIANLRAQGKDIIRTWLHYSMLKGELLYSKPMFDKIWISGHIMDDHGFKMSKSRGNIIKPEPIIAKYGADALRLFGAGEASLGSDIRFNESKLAGQAKFINKLFNIAKFINRFQKIKDFDTNNLYETDKWIISELNTTLKIAYSGFDNFDFFIPTNSLLSFTWELFSNHYIEMIKPRLYSQDDAPGRESCIWTLYFILNAILKAFSPIIPFITDFIYRAMYHESISDQIFEKILELDFTSISELTPKIKHFNASIWKMKQEKNISLKDSITINDFPDDLSQLKDDLIPMHNLILND